MNLYKFSTISQDRIFALPFQGNVPLATGIPTQFVEYLGNSLALFIIRIQSNPEVPSCAIQGSITSAVEDSYSSLSHGPVRT
jgi:hypothetical protein